MENVCDTERNWVPAKPTAVPIYEEDDLDLRSGNYRSRKGVIVETKVSKNKFNEQTAKSGTKDDNKVEADDSSKDLDRRIAAERFPKPVRRMAVRLWCSHCKQIQKIITRGAVCAVACGHTRVK
jgi:ribosomal protein L44E